MEKSVIAKKLREWGAGSISAWDIVEWAESCEADLEGSETELSVSSSLLAQLSIAHQQYVLPCDIPTMLRAIESSDETEAIRELHAYWDSIDYDERKQEVETTYFRSSNKRLQGDAGKPRA